jgi:hypothetical protein
MALVRKKGRRPTTYVGLEDMRARIAGEVQQRQAFLAEAQEALDDCDRTILLLYPNGDPRSIEATRYQRHSLGRRRALRKTMLANLCVPK